MEGIYAIFKSTLKINRNDFNLKCNIINDISLPTDQVWSLPSQYMYKY